MNPVDYNLRGPVAVLTLNNPPVNGLGLALRSGILAGLDRALADPAVTAIVLTGGEKIFSGGADVKEFGTPKSSTSPNLPDVIRALEQSAKPVVAAIAGFALGGGLELALGCHFRVAQKDATLGLPEVKLGLLPGAGGTQRLPRAIGLEAALNMIVSGAPQKAASFEGTALVDELTEANVVDAAVAFAERAAKEPAALPRLRDVKVPTAGADAFLQFARNNVKAAAKGLPAPLACVECVADSVTQPFDEGLKRERAAFFALMATPESRAARHVFAAERAAGKLPDIPADTPLRPINTVGVIGAGTMGGGITMNFLNVGTPVVLLETTQAALDRGLATIRRNYENSVKRGKLKQEQVEAAHGADHAHARLRRLQRRGPGDRSGVRADGREREGLHPARRGVQARRHPGLQHLLPRHQPDRQLHQAPARRAGPALLQPRQHHEAAGNRARRKDRQRRDGHRAGAGQEDQEGGRGLRRVRRLHRQPHAGALRRGGPCAGRARARHPSRWTRPWSASATPWARSAWATWPGWTSAGPRASARPPKPACPTTRPSPTRFASSTASARRSGAGWYRYEPGVREPQADPLIDKLIADYRSAKGVTPRKVSDEEVVERCIYALVNEGARILAEGIAVRASDVDLVYLNGYGFPARRGGPMCYANEVGLANVVRALRRFAAEPGADASWEPAPLLVQLAEEGKTF